MPTRRIVLIARVHRRHPALREVLGAADELPREAGASWRHHHLDVEQPRVERSLRPA